MERQVDRALLDLVRLDFDKDEWIEDDNNILLAEGEDVILFHYEKPGVYQGHYFLKSRGRDAVRLSEEALSIIFNDYDTLLLFGLVPIDNRGSYWMSRHLGFKNQGIVEIEIGPCTLFSMTKEEYNGRSN